MPALLLVLLGAALVIGGIIGLRLPAFLALIGAALTVATLTPAPARLRSVLRGQTMAVARFDPAAGDVTLTPNTTRLVAAGPVHIVRATGEAGGVGTLSTGPSSAKTALRFQGPPLTPGDWLVSDADWSRAQKTSRLNPGELVAQGFGATTTSIGLLIALASVIGACLLESGAAERVVMAVRNAIGEKRAALAFIPSGFLLCIPAFFDTVFYLLMPLGKALRQKTGRDYVLYILCVVAGATMAQSLVPPTPGPLFVADALQIKIFTMMVGGTIVGLTAASAGYLYACWANRRWNIPLRDEALPTEGGSLEVHRQLPPLGWSLLPIILPIALVAAESLTEGRTGPWREWVALFGNKNIALALGAMVALILYAGTRQWKWRSLSKPLNAALESAGAILLITPAGGAFGQALRATDVAGIISGWFTGSGYALLPAAFGVTMLMRLCQGSATVAMITGAGIIAPLALGAPLGYHRVYLALAIGCGSKPISWMNDSGFWIISRMTGMTETETLKTASALMGVMGFSGFAVVLLGAWLWPNP